MLNLFKKCTHDPCQYKHQQSWENFTGSSGFSKGNHGNIIKSSGKAPLVQNVLNCHRAGAVHLVALHCFLLGHNPSAALAGERGGLHNPTLVYKLHSEPRQPTSLASNAHQQCELQHQNQTGSLGSSPWLNINLLRECQ